ncbi:hypothetical protein CK203_117362 [Vitis vinifera]|uniref:Uncharacterized protein n=1 Tax=Vitis vinifera TaxID=29760 RepID=A0A438C9Y5_VITVI|nr:hypothetical protein CK203_117362 [Vitis vinifera]
MPVDPLEQELDVQDHQVGHKDANGLRLKPFPHFDDLSLVFGKDRANEKGAMSAADILEELDQVEASNDIGVDDLEAEVDASHTNYSCIHSK